MHATCPPACHGRRQLEMSRIYPIDPKDGAIVAAHVTSQYFNIPNFGRFHLSSLQPLGESDTERCITRLL